MGVDCFESGTINTRNEFVVDEAVENLVQSSILEDKRYTHRPVGCSYVKETVLIV